MHVLLVGPDLEENLSLRYLAAALRAGGHQATIARFDSIEDFHDVIAQANGVDLVGLSLCYQIRAPEFLCLARALKEQDPQRVVLAGGHYASCAAHELLENHAELDLIVIHEAERTLVELASASDRTPATLASIEGIVYRDGSQVIATPARQILGDLDALAWPDRTGPARLLAGVPSAYMMGSRGCLGACDYCCITTMHRMVPGKRFRQRAPEKIADEMAYLYHQRGVRQFIFHDDNFLVPSVERNLARIDALERALVARGVRDVGLALKCRPADVDRRVFVRLRAMGLLRVFLGIESGTSAGLASIGRHQTVEEQHRALDLCQELGISTQYTIIIFHPEATAQTMLDDLKFVRRHLTQPFSFCRAEIYAGTPLEQRMILAGRAQGDYRARTYDYSDPLIAKIWEAGQTLLRDRCWAHNHLLGQVVRLDHLVTILGHFYTGPEVNALVEEFNGLKLEINRNSVELFENMIHACLEFEGEALEARLSELGEYEQARRDSFQRRLCNINQTLHDYALDSVGLTAVRAPSQRSDRTRLPRHAAAALLAAGLLACGGESSNSDTPPNGGKAGSSSVTGQGGATARGGSSSYVNTGGMFEAPPPPMGGSYTTTSVGGTNSSAVGGTTTGSNTGGSSQRGGSAGTSGKTNTGGYINTGGMFEAPPPPMGGATTNGGSSQRGGSAGTSGKTNTGGYINTGGMFEAPPPPMGGVGVTSGKGGTNAGGGKSGTNADGGKGGAGVAGKGKAGGGA